MANENEEKVVSLDNLKANATPPEENSEEKMVEDEVKEIPKMPTSGLDMRAGMKDPLQALYEREEEKKRAAEEEAARAEAERKNDGREVDYEVNGLNIGDSLKRRLETANRNVAALKEAMEEEDMESEDSEIEEDIEDFSDDDLDIDNEDPIFDVEDEEDDDEEEYIFEESSSNDIEEDLELEEEKMDEDKKVVEEEVVETVEEAVDTVEEVKVEEDAKEAEADVEEKAEEAATAKEDNKLVSPAPKMSSNDLPSQSDMVIDDEDLLDIDLDDDSDSDDDDDLSDEEMEGLRNQIKDRLNSKSKNIEGMKVVKKAVSLSAALGKCAQDINSVDWPLMSAGKNVTMKAFSGTEIDALNRGASGRNRFNTMKEIYRNIYDHILSEKPDFEMWLRTTSFMDIEHLYMAIYKASFDKANYIPYNCTNSDCNHVFLSEDIDIMDMCKFKDADAKKRFMSIYENDREDSTVEAKLYPTTIVPITDTIAIGFREPSIYNTIFENSVLDAKFVDKYTSLLTMMVYIDEMYVIDGNNLVPIRYKKDKQSVAKTTKYRIATYAKIINALPSDGYNKIVGVIGQINELGDEVQYCMPEITCPKCGKTIESSITQANQLLFSRHQLNLLSQQ